MRVAVRRSLLAAVLIGSMCFVDPALAGTNGAISWRTLGVVASATENSASVINRDAGLSVPLPNGRDLWIFGDSWNYELVRAIGPVPAHWRLARAVIGGSAALATIRPGAVPTQLQEISPGVSTSAPHVRPFLPEPTDVYLPDGSGRNCSRSNGAAFAARWPTGAALLADRSDVLVTYSIACVMLGGAFTIEGWGFEVYRWTTNSFSTTATDVFLPRVDGSSLPREMDFGSPIVHNGNVSLVSLSGCAPSFTTCPASSLEIATVPVTISQLSNPLNYRPLPASAQAGVLWSLWVNVTQISASNFVAVDEMDNSGDVVVAHSTKLSGPWRLQAQIHVPCTSDGVDSCRAYVLHPELAKGSAAIFTYFNPLYLPRAARGHLVGVVVNGL